MMAVEKIIVDVKALYQSADGLIRPLAIVWADGRCFEIDRVTDVRRAASLKAGGRGLRYTVRIRGQQRYLFYDDGEGCWFVESAPAH